MCSRFEIEIFAQLGPLKTAEIHFSLLILEKLQKMNVTVSTNQISHEGPNSSRTTPTVGLNVLVNAAAPEIE